MILPDGAVCGVPDVVVCDPLPMIRYRSGLSSPPFKGEDGTSETPSHLPLTPALETEPYTEIAPEKEAASTVPLL
jgi:hypothetical protein